MRFTLRTVGPWVVVGGFAAASFGVATATNPAALAPAPVTAGFDHACGLTQAGEAWCWGSNDVGELGDGTTDPSREPKEVAGGPSFTSLVAGHNRTCAIAAGGALWCWGQNTFGELGDGAVNEHRSEPVRIAPELSFEAVSVGSHHTCGIVAGGELLCWGRNARGELGDSTTENRPLPTPVRADLLFTDVAAGFDHTCALTDAGEAYCWGSNLSGQIGDGTNDDSTVPKRVAGTTTFATLAAGYHRTCALDAEGAAYCWGHNLNGGVGDGTETSKTEPTPVAGEHRFTWISAGAHHACGVTDAGSTVCWGHNGFGQLGDGSRAARSTPTAVQLPQGVSLAFVSAGGYHTCGVTGAGGSYCWGHDLTQRVGTAEAPVPPTVVAEQPLFRARELVGALDGGR